MLMFCIYSEVSTQRSAAMPAEPSVSNTYRHRKGWVLLLPITHELPLHQGRPLCYLQQMCPIDERQERADAEEPASNEKTHRSRRTLSGEPQRAQGGFHDEERQRVEQLVQETLFCIV